MNENLCNFGAIWMSLLHGHQSIWFSFDSFVAIIYRLFRNSESGGLHKNLTIQKTIWHKSDERTFKLLDRQILVVLTIFLYYFTALQVYQKFKNSIFYLFIFRTYNFCLFIKQLYCKKMASPALKDLPKVDSDLKSQLEGFKSNRLSHTETKEKVILPSAEGE